MLRILNDDAAPYIGDKLPYAVSAETDYTLPVHGDRRGRLHAALEIRQDQIAEPAGQAAWATWLELLLRRVLERFPEVWSRPSAHRLAAKHRLSLRTPPCCSSTRRTSAPGAAAAHS